MIKALVKVIIMVLLANGLWRVTSAYMSFYKFRDAVTEAAAAGRGQTDEQLKDKVMDLAASHDEPLAADAVTIRRDDHHTYIEGSYTKPIAVLPGVEYQWPFAINVDDFVLTPVNLDLAHPQ